MEKKGVELTLNTIIITVLVVIVLVVLVIAFKSQIANLFSAFNNLISGASNAAGEVDVGSVIK